MAHGLDVPQCKINYRPQVLPVISRQDGGGGEEDSEPKKYESGAEGQITGGSDHRSARLDNNTFSACSDAPAK